MTKMAVMPIFGKNELRFCISGTERPMTLKPGMQHGGLWLYIVYSNDDLSLTLTYFTTGSALVSKNFVWQNGIRDVFIG